MSGHPWCSDTARDEAIRQAEDAAAAERTPLPDHRDLPQAVKELRERVGRLEAAKATIGSGDVFRDVGCGTTGDEIVRLTAERDAAIRERDEARADAEHDVREVLALARKERDAARAEAERLKAEKAADWKAACESALAASIMVGELKARVAELENAAKLAPAANAGGEVE